MAQYIFYLLFIINNNYSCWQKKNPIIVLFFLDMQIEVYIDLPANYQTCDTRL